MGQGVVVSDNDDDGTPILSPAPIALPVSSNDNPVVTVFAGYAHSVSTTKRGLLFVFGQNDNWLGLSWK